MKMFQVMRMGIRINSVGGVFSSLHKAMAAADTAIMSEPDDYHIYVIRMVVLDESVPLVHDENKYTSAFDDGVLAITVTKKGSAFTWKIEDGFYER